MAALTAKIAKCGALRAPEAVGAISVTKRNKSSSTDINNYKRGTGGRSSFSGVVATVFGGKSVLGNLVINRLGKVGSQVILPYRGDPIKLQGFKLHGDLGQILFQPMELRDEESIRMACKYSNVVINLIGKNYQTKNYSFDDVHVQGARTIARIARECGVEKLVHVSCMMPENLGKGVYQKGGSEFLSSKAAGEIAVREEFPEATIIRPSDFVDMNDHFLTVFLEKWRVYRRYQTNLNFRRWELPLYKHGIHTVKMPVLPKNVSSGIMAALRSKDSAGKTYQCVGPQAYRLLDLVEFAYKCTLQPIEFTDDMSKMVLRARIREQIFMSLGLPRPKFTVDKLERDAVSDVLDPTLPTLEDLGVTPVSVEDTIHWMLKARANLQAPETMFHKVTFPRPSNPEFLFSTSK